MRSVLFLLVVVVQPACTQDRARLNPDAGAGGVDGGGGGGHPGGATLYRDVEELYEQALTRTCSLNGGVCHNSKEYPDVHTLSSLFSALEAPCGLGALSPRDVPNECEPEGDHLVSAALGVDVEIKRVDVSPRAAATADLTGATVVLARAAGGAGGSATDWTVVRGDLRFTLGAGSLAADRGSLQIDLTAAPAPVRAFVDYRTFPWSPSMIRVADTNGDGVAGHALGWALLRPGDPDHSYLVGRLTQPRLGELMPRQCRTWDWRATLALYCWTKGLRMGSDGRPSNAMDPINYVGCTLPPDAVERCGGAPPDGGVGGFADVQAIFTRSCAFSGCHAGGGAAAAGLDLSPGRAYGSLVGVGSSEAPGRVRVQAGSAAASVLFCKVDPSCADRPGALMPLSGGALSDADREVLRSWIQSGAMP